MRIMRKDDVDKFIFGNIFTILLWLGILKYKMLNDLVWFSLRQFVK